MFEAEDQNLFLVDWNTKNPTIFYTASVIRVDIVAAAVAEFIDRLHDLNLADYKRVSLIGYSLGAHIAGIAGKKIKQGNKVKKVIGLDAAGPVFDLKKSKDRLSPKSASYTECIHTGYAFGIRDAICHADFYINGGAQQPGCGEDNVICSHSRVLDIYIESLAKPEAFYGARCENLDAAVQKSCSDENQGAFLMSPQNVEKSLEGIFHVKTNSKSPFGRGRAHH